MSLPSAAHTHCPNTRCRAPLSMVQASEGRCPDCGEWLPPPDAPRCPKCDSTKLESGYGFAGGGIGAYTYCAACGVIVDKVLDHEMEAIDGNS